MHAIIEKAKERGRKAKTWIKEHKKELLIGGVLTFGGALVLALKASQNVESTKEDEDVKELVDVCVKPDETDEYEDFEVNDRYVIDADLIDKLPPGEYDVFDMYENERVDYTVKEE